MRALEGRVAKPGPRPIGLALLGLLAAGALLFWPNLGPLAARGSPRTVTILYTGYTQGRVDAKSVCAWAGEEVASVGGLARRAKYLRSATVEHPDALVVDTGGSLAGGSDSAVASADRFLARGLALMGYDVLNVSVGEARAGRLVAQELAASDAPALLASLGAAPESQVAASSLLEGAAPYVVRESGGVRVGFVGVPFAEDTAAGMASAVSSETLEALRRLLPEVRRHADVVVCLADLEPQQVENLAAAGLDLDVVLGGRSTASRPASRIGRTVVAVAGAPDYVGRLTLQVGADSKVVAFLGDDTFLDDVIPEDPELLALREQLR